VDTADGAIDLSPAAAAVTAATGTGSPGKGTIEQMQLTPNDTATDIMAEEKTKKKICEIENEIEDHKKDIKELNNEIKETTDNEKKKELRESLGISRKLYLTLREELIMLMKKQQTAEIG
jgi:hypothetical protein